VAAVEIIEHLENPRHFLREIRKMLRPGGHLFLTTPNVDSPLSKAFHMAYGYHLWFDDSQYKVSGHITPVSIRTLRQAAEEAGFTVEQLQTFGNAWETVRRWPKMRWYARVVSLLDRMPRDLRGDILIAVFVCA
jgi:2-polyprenyl-3-methyl-5-hydroxy-6-metoxy-1,4-benzoquinol methylase